LVYFINFTYHNMSDISGSVSASDSNIVIRKLLKSIFNIQWEPSYVLLKSVPL
jgi:hypothetical protein